MVMPGATQPGTEPLGSIDTIWRKPTIPTGRFIELVVITADYLTGKHARFPIFDFIPAETGFSLPLARNTIAYPKCNQYTYKRVRLNSHRVFGGQNGVAGKAVENT